MNFFLTLRSDPLSHALAMSFSLLSLCWTRLSWKMTSFRNSVRGLGSGKLIRPCLNEVVKTEGTRIDIKFIRKCWVGIEKPRKGVGLRKVARPPQEEVFGKLVLERRPSESVSVLFPSCTFWSLLRWRIWRVRRASARSRSPSTGPHISSRSDLSKSTSKSPPSLSRTTDYKCHHRHEENWLHHEFHCTLSIFMNTFRGFSRFVTKLITNSHCPIILLSKTMQL